VYAPPPPPPLVRGEDTLAGWRGGVVVNILEDARHCSVLYICKYYVDKSVRLPVLQQSCVQSQHPPTPKNQTIPPKLIRKIQD
jgi:hypothetical protein